MRKFQYSIYTRDIFTRITSFDNEGYICGTCHFKARKGQIPCQAVCNKLEIDDMPSKLYALRKLESVLFAQRLVFQKIVVMPKGTNNSLCLPFPFFYLYQSPCDHVLKRILKRSAYRLQIFLVKMNTCDHYSYMRTKVYVKSFRSWATVSLIHKEPVKLMQLVKIAHSFLRSESNQFLVIILGLPVQFYK